MNSKKLKEALASLCFGASALILAFALLLAPTQTAFAGADPSIPPHLMANTSVGTADGGGGIVDVNRLGSGQVKRNNPTAARYEGGKSGGGSSGVVLFEFTSFGYYQVMFDITFIRLFGSRIESSSSGVPQHE